MLAMLKGLLPAGRPGSVKVPGTLTCVKFLSNTSIRPAALLAPYRKTSAPLFPAASPVYPTGAGAPVAARIATMERVAGGTGGGTPRFHPEMVPFKPANRKAAGPEPPPCETTKPEESLDTRPEGGAGMPTGKRAFVTEPVTGSTPYTVAVLLPAWPTQN